MTIIVDLLAHYHKIYRAHACVSVIIQHAVNAVQCCFYRFYIIGKALLQYCMTISYQIPTINNIAVISLRYVGVVM